MIIKYDLTNDLICFSSELKSNFSPKLENGDEKKKEKGNKPVDFQKFI